MPYLHWVIYSIALYVVANMDLGPQQQALLLAYLVGNRNVINEVATSQVHCPPWLELIGSLAAGPIQEVGIGIIIYCQVSFPPALIGAGLKGKTLESHICNCKKSINMYSAIAVFLFKSINKYST